MTRVALVSCASKKRSEPSRAKDLYISPLFEKSLRYAYELQPDYIFILSAKYGLLDLDKVIEPYNVTLMAMSSRQRKEWAVSVLAQLESRFDLKQDEFVFLAGKKYRENLVPHMRHYEVPLVDLPIGKQLQRLKELLNE